MNQFPDVGERPPDSFENDKALLGKCVEIDDTKLDLFVIDANSSRPVGRPWLTVTVCPFTRLVLSYELSSER